MKRYLNTIWVSLVLAVVFSCGPKKDPDPQSQLPSYFRLPANLDGYAGSGLVTVDGDLTLRAEGPEMINPTTKTYSGVLGGITDDDITAKFTVGQPLPYTQTYSVPAEYQSNGQLLTKNAIEPGTYPMGFESQTSPTGADTDLIINMPGPQLYSARLGTMTISESTLIKSEGTNKLYRIQGTFQTSLFGTGIGAVSSKDYRVTGVFDLLLLD